MTPSDSVRLTHSADGSSASTGPTDRSTTTSAPSQATLFEGGLARLSESATRPTPTASDSDTSPMDLVRHASLTSFLNRGGLTSSPPVTPANPSVMPGSDWARRMTAISGRKLRGWLPTSGPVGACLRTLLATSAWASMTCYLTWKTSVTPGGRRLFRLVPSTPRTGATGFGLWPMWPTPTAASASHPGRVKIKDGQQMQLSAAVRLWPTPDAGMVTGGRRNPEGTSETGQMPDGRKVQVGLTNAVAGKLSAAWVAKLMGYPADWLDT